VLPFENAAPSPRGAHGVEADARTSPERRRRVAWCSADAQTRRRGRNSHRACRKSAHSGKGQLNEKKKKSENKMDALRIARLPQALRRAVAGFLSPRDILRLEALQEAHGGAIPHLGAARLAARATARCGGRSAQAAVRADLLGERVQSGGGGGGGGGASLRFCAALAIERAAAPLTGVFATPIKRQRLQLWVQTKRRAALGGVWQVDLDLARYTEQFVVGVAAWNRAGAKVALQRVPALQPFWRRYPPTFFGEWRSPDVARFSVVVAALLLLFADRAFVGSQWSSGHIAAGTLRRVLGAGVPIAVRLAGPTPALRAARRALLAADDIRWLRGADTAEQFGAGTDTDAAPRSLP
jgi:hypothetical protein